MFDENHNPLPKFKAPRQILHSSGWKPLSVMDGLASRSQQGEEQAEAGSGNLPARTFDNASTSITSLKLTSSTTLVLQPPIPSDDPMDDSLPSNVNTSNSSSNKIGFNALLSSPLQVSLYSFLFSERSLT